MASAARGAGAARRGHAPSRIPAPTNPTSTSTPVLIVHEDTQHRKRRKEARRAEIVAAVTRRLYSTKKEPAGGGTASPDATDVTTQASGPSTDEPEELKLCSNARARLQEIGRKVMKRMRRSCVDVEVQTDLRPAVLRVREAAVQVAPLNASCATQTVQTKQFSSDQETSKSSESLVYVTRSKQTQSQETPSKDVAVGTELPVRQSFYLNYQRRCKTRGAPPSYSIVFRKRVNRIENEYYSDDSLEDDRDSTPHKSTTPSTSVAPSKSLGSAEACALIRELRALFLDWQQHVERNRPIKQVESRLVQTDPEFRIRERANHADVRVIYNENKNSDVNDEDGLREGTSRQNVAVSSATTTTTPNIIPWNILNMYIMKSLMSMPHFPKPPPQESKPDPSTSQDFDPGSSLPKRLPSPPPTKEQDHRREIQDMILGRGRQSIPFNQANEEQTERKVIKSTKKKSVSWTDLSGLGSLHTEIGTRERRNSLDIAQPCRLQPLTLSLTPPPPPVTAVQMTAFIKEAGHLLQSLSRIQKNEEKKKKKPREPSTIEKSVQTDTDNQKLSLYQNDDDDDDPDLQPQTFYEPKTWLLKRTEELEQMDIGTNRSELNELISPRIYRERLLAVRRNIVAEERIKSKY